MVGKRLMTYIDDSWKINNGFFEFIPEDGMYVDLTQPGLLSQGQITHIFWRRGFASLVRIFSTSFASFLIHFIFHRSRSQALVTFI
ncbi:unnamed protein product [Hymenolepis diminuta]|uniref:Uncharacterized protein n=1 Tax=Hymenolepis diminuta TaxID=6216 RepID=A0A564XXI9_HYMDI|nr:unnamed protein product [Hymenolepis diminuta]